MQSQSVSLKSIIISSSHLLLGLPSGLFPFSFCTKTLHVFLLSPTRVSCPVHLTLNHFNKLKYLASTNHKVSHYAVPSSLPLLPPP